MIRKFARPYAKAALASVANDAEASALLGDLERFELAMAKVPRIAAMAGNPAIPMDNKQSAVEEIAANLQLSSLARRLILLLTENYRLQHVGDVTAAVREQVRKRLGVVSAAVASAAPLDESQTARLQEVLQKALGKKVELEVTVEPELLGGFVAQVGSRRYDISLKGQLERMAEEMAAPVGA